jgi:hypothetical protein
MARIQSKSVRIVIIVIVAVALLVVGAVFLTKKSSPVATNATDTSKVTPAKDTTSATNVTDATPATTPSTAAPPVDPQTLTSIDVQPLGVTVFYSKGTPGFQYSVLKTADKTQYVEFTSADLVGTKCTDDQGVFASIIKNPSSTESQTTSQTVKIGNDTYGLSLASASCTSNADLLAQYQTGFKNGFANLKAL